MKKIKKEVIKAERFDFKLRQKAFREQMATHRALLLERVKEHKKIFGIKYTLRKVNMCKKLKVRKRVVKT